MATDGVSSLRATCWATANVYEEVKGGGQEVGRKSRSEVEDEAKEGLTEQDPTIRFNYRRISKKTCCW